MLTEKELQRINDSRFVNEYAQGRVTVDGESMPLGYYILQMSISDLENYIKRGKMPYRGWRLGYVKDYFNVSGNKASVVLEKLLELKKQIRS